jgi:Mur ligase middle domain/Mur ligase family, catalytic domain
MPLWTHAELLAATGGTGSGEFDANGVAFDSREIGKGDLFFAMKGEATDGHLFIDKAFANGAAGAIVSEPVGYPHILVDDTMAALNTLGAASRDRMQGQVVGVTGSAGKTGTKEALYAALDRSSRGKAHRSVKSYNNHVGVPLSLSRMPRDTQYGVFEMGMNHPGELRELTRLVRPHAAIVTTIAPAHIEFFKDESAIADAKAVSPSARGGRKIYRKCCEFRFLGGGRCARTRPCRCGGRRFADNGKTTNWRIVLYIVAGGRSLDCQFAGRACCGRSGRCRSCGGWACNGGVGRARRAWCAACNCGG